MPLQLYKANKSGKGAAASFSFNSKENNVYIGLIRQVSWDDSKRVGSFKGGERINLKFSLIEVGGMIYALENNTEFSAYHSSPNMVSQISLKPYEKDGKPMGFGFSILQTKNSTPSKFLLGLTYSDAVLIREYLKFSLEHCFSAIYSDDKKRYQDKLDKKEQIPEQTAPPEEPVLEESVSEETPKDEDPFDF